MTDPLAVAELYLRRVTWNISGWYTTFRPQ